MFKLQFFTFISAILLPDYSAIPESLEVVKFGWFDNILNDFVVFSLHAQKW